MRIFLYAVLIAFLAVPGAAFAEEGVPEAVTDPAPAATAPAAAPVAEPQQDPVDLEDRLALARKMHEINPTRLQVEAAVNDIAATQPEADRETFKTALRGALNYQAIEKISIDAMAETYTKAELEAMVEYFSKPEAKSAAKKDVIYNRKVFPQIARMLDQSIMRIRTGGQ